MGILSSFVTGALAGYAIAVPFGSIALLILDLGIRRGFFIAAAAGAGAATADGLYAALAAAGGTAVAQALAPFQAWLRIAAAAALVAIAVRGLRRASLQRDAGSADSDPDADPGGGVAPRQRAATYLRFIALTLLNPATVVYFAALILGLPALDRARAARAAFVVGAFLASLSWQTVLAAIGSIAHHRLPTPFQNVMSVAGNLAILGFAAGILTGIAG
ncbi:MAG TPA: LysE family transporter [Candidatus Limnocylindrales bacterium]